MTKKKKRQLEEERMMMEAAKKEAEQKQATQPSYYGGMNMGAVPGGIPVLNSKVGGIQLPPIIQPISFVPTPMQVPFGFETSKKDDFDDDFDDDDWF
jgi:hypothetical protein